MQVAYLCSIHGEEKNTKYDEAFYEVIHSGFIAINRLF